MINEVPSFIENNRKGMERMKDMFYALNDNVYLVKGSKHGCIYDFNSSKLYSINDVLMHEIDLVNNGKILFGSVIEELEIVFEELIERGILILSETPIRHYIDEIKSEGFGPSFAWIEITNKCNLKCIHCYNESDAHKDLVMSLDNYKIVIDKILELGISRIQIIGGEPFLNKQALRAMLDYVIGKFSFIEIFTNGTLLPEEWMDFLADNNIHIALSVYSYREEMHDRVTGNKGMWLKTNRTINALKSHNIHYRVCNVLMKDIEIGKRTTDLYQIDENRDIVRMAGRANFSLLSDELIKKKLITKESFSTPIKKSFVSRLMGGHNCFQKDIYISADMNVFPCVMERRMKHCEINVNSKIILDDLIRTFNKDKINECCHCEYRYVCFDCRPDSLSGDLYEKPWYCTYKPLLGEWGNEDDFIVELRKKWET